MIAHDGEWCRVVSYDEADAAKLAAITDQNTLLCDATADQMDRFDAAARSAGHASGHSAANDGDLWDETVADAIALAGDQDAITDQNTLLCDATAEQWGRFERAASVAGHASGHSAANDGDLWDETVADAIALAGDREECE